MRSHLPPFGFMPLHLCICYGPPPLLLASLSLGLGGPGGRVTRPIRPRPEPRAPAVRWSRLCGTVTLPPSFAGSSAGIGEPILSGPHLALMVPPEAVVHLEPRRPHLLSGAFSDNLLDHLSPLPLGAVCLLRWHLESGPHEHAEDVALIRPVVYVYEDGCL